MLLAEVKRQIRIAVTYCLFDLFTDPKEEYPATLTPIAWVADPMMKIIGEFEKSITKYPLIKPGTPDPYQPPNNKNVK